MALCTFSSKLVMDGYTVLDNTFLNEFLPQATGDDVKVLPYAAPPAGTSDRAVSIIPEMFDKVVALFKKKDKAEEAPATEEIDAEAAAALAEEASK